jgi:hypothetical protein
MLRNPDAPAIHRPTQKGDHWEVDFAALRAYREARNDAVRTRQRRDAFARHRHRVFTALRRRFGKTAAQRMLYGCRSPQELRGVAEIWRVPGDWATYPERFKDRWGEWTDGDWDAV